MTHPLPSADELRSALTAFLAAHLPPSAEPVVADLRRLGGGSSQENWAFDACWADDGSAFGMPALIVERRSGRAHRGVLREDDPLRLGPGGRQALAGELADLLAAVHRVDVSATGLDAALPGPGGNPAVLELDHWIAELDRVELEPQPALRFTIEWLREHLPPPPERVVLLHGDFRPANVLVADGRIAALLDWELARLGDPADDLGWYLASVYAGEHFIPGRWERADFLTRYADRCPRPDELRLHFWTVMSMFRLCVIALTAVRNFCRGESSRPAAPPHRLIAATLHDTGLLR
jgi:aminoglycoside phosphotransferase (APT) family kinase protein